MSRRVLVAGGLDPSGRAGVLADVEAVRAHGGTPLVIVTALTAQGGKTFRCEPVSHSVVRDQLAALKGVDAVKLGMVPTRTMLSLLVDFAGARPLVIDPVVRTSKGEPLSSLTPRDYRQVGQGVLTPNEDELDWLDVSAPELIASGFDAVVLKRGASAHDLVFARGAAIPVSLRGRVLPRSTRHHRGTGCRFASSLATRLAAGDSVLEAARVAKSYVRKFLAAPILDDA